MSHRKGINKYIFYLILTTNFGGSILQFYMEKPTRETESLRQQVIHHVSLTNVV